MSAEAFDKPREIQVIVDANDKLYISVGTPSYVSFESQDEQLEGMTLPLKCWIHTHPFGKAYFSGTDWSTIRTWEPVMNYAIVLGGDESMEWIKGEDHTVFYQKREIPEYVFGEQTQLKDHFEIIIDRGEEE